MTPQMLPMPPRMIIASTMIEIEKSNWNGIDELQHAGPQRAGEARERGAQRERQQLGLDQVDAHAEAASSSSRIAIQARPMREFAQPVDREDRDAPTTKIR